MVVGALWMENGEATCFPDSGWSPVEVRKELVPYLNAEVVTIECPNAYIRLHFDRFMMLRQTGPWMQYQQAKVNEEFERYVNSFSRQGREDRDW
jgi:hypothetical protein